VNTSTAKGEWNSGVLLGNSEAAKVLAPELQPESECVWHSQEAMGSRLARIIRESKRRTRKRHDIARAKNKADAALGRPL